MDNMDLLERVCSDRFKRKLEPRTGLNTDRLESLDR